MGSDIYAGVELGGTKCVLLLARGPDEILARAQVPTSSVDETLGAIEGILACWQSAQGFSALGIASFGPLELDPGSSRHGEILSTPKAGWTGAKILSRLRSASAVPAKIETDVTGAALAEMQWGSGRGMNDFAYVTVGTGVGVGLIANGMPMRGFAHCELGHIRPARRLGDSWSGSCPFHGDCVEGLASGPAIKARIGPASGWPPPPDDPVWADVSWAISQLCHTIVCAAAPRAIAIGGGVIDNNPHVLESISAMLVESLGGYLNLPQEGPFIRAPELGRDAGPLGAIALAMSARR